MPRCVLSCVNPGVVVSAEMGFVAAVAVTDTGAIRLGIAPPVIVPVTGPSVDLGTVGIIARDTC